MMQKPENPLQNAVRSIFFVSAQRLTAFVTSEKMIIKFFMKVTFVKELNTVLITVKKHIHAHIEITDDTESEMLSESITEKGFAGATAFSL